uniref:Uncharacterized protein n=1 Tax=Plectus sambesii TaxID=2011161 RepID=A0A914VQS7_9BILA
RHYRHDRGEETPTGGVSDSVRKSIANYMLDKYKDDRRGIGAETRKKEGRDRDRRDDRRDRDRDRRDDRRDRDRNGGDSNRSDRFRGGPRTPLFK